MVLVGPWTTEIGFELLYWIPFLRHFAAAYRVGPGRMVAISRGGVAEWYAGVCGHYVDLFDLIDVEQFVNETAAREEAQGVKKTFDLAPNAFERQIYGLVAKRLGLTDYTVLSPSAMYTMFRNIWRGRSSGDRMLKWLDIRPIEARYPKPDLPFRGDYVALKFYKSNNFALNKTTRLFMDSLIRQLSSKTRVVLLNTGIRLDDHVDAYTSHNPDVFDASCLYGAHGNLAVQSALVAHAKSLHCTYGGFAYLGPLLGIPTVGYFTKPQFVGTHLDLAIRWLDPRAGLLSVCSIKVTLAQSNLGAGAAEDFGAGQKKAGLTGLA